MIDPLGLCLIGMRRSGKSSVGLRVAQRSGRPFIDLDEVVAQREGLEPGAILRSRGEEVFRRMESEALEEAMETRGAVIATGGGTPIRRSSRARLKGYGLVVYLEVSFEVLLTRARRDRQGDPERPLLCGATVEEEIRLLLAQRAALYRGLADWSIDADGDTDASVSRCLELLEAKRN